MDIYINIYIQKGRFWCFQIGEYIKKENFRQNTSYYFISSPVRFPQSLANIGQDNNGAYSTGPHDLYDTFQNKSFQYNVEAQNHKYVNVNVFCTRRADKAKLWWLLLCCDN